MATNDPQPGVPTATGTLQGSAQFVWNGTAWVAQTGVASGTTGGTDVEEYLRLAAITVSPAVTAGAYAAGNCVGGLMTLSNAVRAAGYGGVLRKVIVSFLAGNTPTLDLLLFNANPTGSTFTDRSAVAVVAADVTSITGACQIADYTLAAASTMSVGQAIVAIPFIPAAAATTMYAQLVARSAFTPTGIADLSVRFVIQQSGF